MKRRLDDDPLLPVRSAYDNENAVYRRDGKPLLPTFNSVETMLQRHKSIKLPHSRDEVQITGDWAMTGDRRRLLFPTGDADMVIFATDDNLRTLSAATSIYLDGTFKACLLLYAQLYTVHALVDSQVVQLVYALLANKQRTTYYDFFEILCRAISNLGLIWDPQYIVTDFEAGSIEALRQHFAQACQIGCFFHFCSALWRCVQDLRLSSPYKTDNEFRIHVQSHMAVAFLPVSCVSETVGRLHTEYADNDAVVAFLQYFRSTWLDGMFTVALWNQYNVDSRMRTNNYVESWHAWFNRVVRGAHPILYIFIAHIKWEEGTVSTTLAQLRHGCTLSKRRAKYDAVDRRIKQAREEYMRSDIDAHLLLRRIRHVMHVFH